MSTQLDTCLPRTNTVVSPLFKNCAKSFWSLHLVSYLWAAKFLTKLGTYPLEWFTSTATYPAQAYPDLKRALIIQCKIQPLHAQLSSARSRPFILFKSLAVQSTRFAATSDDPARSSRGTCCGARLLAPPPISVQRARRFRPASTPPPSRRPTTPRSSAKPPCRCGDRWRCGRRRRRLPCRRRASSRPPSQPRAGRG